MILEKQAQALVLQEGEETQVHQGRPQEEEVNDIADESAAEKEIKNTGIGK